MSHEFTTAELEAYLNEELPTDEMSKIEQAMRSDEALVARLVEINQRRDVGVHTLGEVWRRHRLSCPSREQLGSYLLEATPAELSNYILFHLTEIGCRYCHANLQDLKQKVAANPGQVEQRRSKYFQSSVGYLDHLED